MPLKSHLYSRAHLVPYLIAVVLVLVPFHALLTVWISSWAGHYTALRLWDEVALLIVFLIECVWLVRDRALSQKLMDSFLFRLVLAFCLLIVAFGVLALLRHTVSPKALGYALIIDLRGVLWLVLVWVAAAHNPWLIRHWRRVVFWPLAVVAVFALLQFFVLPHDFLSHFGYGSTTIAPATTINQNTNTIRSQASLRGPNELGAYLALGLVLLVGLVTAVRRRWRLALLIVLALAALFLSFSRSAWIGAFVGVVLVSWWQLKSRPWRMGVAVASAALVLIVAGAFVAFRNSRGVQDALLHVHAGSTAASTSNAGHESDFVAGVRDIVRQPLGRGPGTAGPASFYNSAHGGERDSEDLFLQLGQEAGWPGLVLFIAILVVLGNELWQRRSSPLALALLAALGGLVLTNIVSYAWDDDTLAYLFWGLAGLALTLPAARTSGR